MGIMNFLFEEGESKPTSSPATPAQPQVTAQPVVVPNLANTTFQVPPVVQAGVVDEKFMKHFNNLLEKSNIPGADYYEFSKALEATMSMQGTMTEQARFNMVLATMNVSGQQIDKNKLVATANQYLAIFEQDFKEQNAVLDEKKNREVGGREAQINSIAEENAKKAELIQKLTQEIQENQQKVGALQQEIIVEGNKIEANRQNFTQTYNVYTGKIKNDITNITTLLQ